MSSSEKVPLITPSQDSQPDSLQVTEIFHSIQGESTYAGRPCVFIRLTGCPLRCTWCDTAYAFEGGESMSEREVLQRVQGFHCALVEVTGGEPLHQPAGISLIKKLCSEGYEVLIETSGTIDISVVDPRAHIILDIKCPGSGMLDRMKWENLSFLQQKDEAKFVIQDRGDYEWARSILEQYSLPSRCPVLFSPVHEMLELRQLAEWILADALSVRFQVQLHKFIWGSETRGV